MGNPRDLQAQSTRPKHKAFKACEPGYLHVDVKYLPQMADETSRRYLFVAIDRATRWVFIRIYNSKTAANARRFLRDLERACPISIRMVLTDRAMARRHRRADVDGHGGKFCNRDRRGADAVHRGSAERKFRLGPSGRRGIRRGVRAGDQR